MKLLISSHIQSVLVSYINILFLGITCDTNQEYSFPCGVSFGRETGGPENYQHFLFVRYRVSRAKMHPINNVHNFEFFVWEYPKDGRRVNDFIDSLE